MSKKTILFIHQSSELYGSDKTLFYLAKCINENPQFNAIVVLPHDGPLKKLLEENAIKVLTTPIVKVSRSMFNFKNILLLPFTIVSSVWKLRKSLKNVKIDIIHSNTVAVLVGAFYSKIYNIKHIWHIHEIIEKPKPVKLAYPVLMHYFSNKVVYNSEATKSFYNNENKKLIKKSNTILNGLDRDQQITPLHVKMSIKKERFKANENDIIIGLVGRINKRKGHNLLLNSFENLLTKYDNIKLVFVGSAPPGQDFIVDDLQNLIAEKNLKSKCIILPFQTNIWRIYDSMDIVVVPSTEPESFGLVALEAMLSSKAVIASNHGGIREIVRHNKTGFLFEPGNMNELMAFLEVLITDKAKCIEFGQEGEKRAKEKFSLYGYMEEFTKLYSGI
ncbi:glycosyltransferase family 4 protein [Psychroserpens mesophilus]|uniref:glycosyltransferase family 4 protein n=1 Tax=Psychroserpens mesophilus TaxID=325473 RepID=UPI003F493383